MTKIALIGSAPSSVRLAPYGSPDWRIWACSPGAHVVVPRSDVWFELHRWEPGQPWFQKDYVNFLKNYPGTVWMAEQVPEVPNCKVIPVDYLVSKYGPYFFTSSLAWMFALAMEENPQSIGLWGVDMAACPSPETKVLRDDLRWVRADELKIGDGLIAFDEEPIQGVGSINGKRRYRRATVIRNDRITKPCYRLTLEDGREIVCSDEHKWLTYAENQMRWRMAKDLVTPHHRDDRPTRIVKVFDVWEEDKSWGAGYLAAAFDGEGHVHQKLREEHYGVLRAGFAQRDNAMLSTVCQLMEEKGFLFAEDAKAAGMNGDVVKCSIRGGRAKTMEFLGKIRPRRLLEKFNPEHLGIFQKEETVAVVNAEFIGEQTVIGLTTSTGTFIAEGLATHNTEEYGYQRAGCQFFAMLARSKGIEVGVPPESDLLRPAPLYGVCETSHIHIKMLARDRELKQRLANVQAEYQQKYHEMTFLQGAIDDLNWNQQTWAGNVDTSGKQFVEPPVVPALADVLLYGGQAGGGMMVKS